MNLSNVDLLSLQTEHMKKDATTIAMCAALNTQFQNLNDELKCLLIYSRVDSLSDEILDELAWQMHCDWYDSTSDLTTKRNLVKNALKVHQYRGTPYAVEEVIQTYFGDGYVQEWFEYGGEPYMFQVITSNSSVTNELATRFEIAVNSVKNLRSYLEKIVIDLSGEMDIYYGGIVHTGDTITLTQEG